MKSRVIFQVFLALIFISVVNGQGADESELDSVRSEISRTLRDFQEHFRRRESLALRAFVGDLNLIYTIIPDDPELTYIPAPLPLNESGRAYVASLLDRRVDTTQTVSDSTGIFYVRKDTLLGFRDAVLAIRDTAISKQDTAIIIRDGIITTPDKPGWYTGIWPSGVFNIEDYRVAVGQEDSIIVGVHEYTIIPDTMILIRQDSIIRSQRPYLAISDTTIFTGQKTLVHTRDTLVTGEDTIFIGRIRSLEIVRRDSSVTLERAQQVLDGLIGVDLEAVLNLQPPDIQPPPGYIIGVMHPFPRRFQYQRIWQDLPRRYPIITTAPEDYTEEERRILHYRLRSMLPGWASVGVLNDEFLVFALPPSTLDAHDGRATADVTYRFNLSVPSENDIEEAGFRFRDRSLLF